MIRAFQSTDVFRYAMFGCSSLTEFAYTLEKLFKDSKFRLSLMDILGLYLASKRKDRCVTVDVHQGQVVGVATARSRLTSNVWEICQLLLSKNNISSYTDMLKIMSNGVAKKGGEKLFIRVPNDENLVYLLRSAGFILCNYEDVYVGVLGNVSNVESSEYRVKHRVDEFQLFRLYNACTPAEIRFIFGVTFDQWKASRESALEGSQEFVCEQNGEMRGWVRVSRCFGSAQLIAMLHQDVDVFGDSLVDYGLSKLTGKLKVYCLVPKHQLRLRRILENRGYHSKGEYVTLVKNLVAFAKTEEISRAVEIKSN